MCTVSVIATPGGFRLACNRDELRTRPVALPPRVVRFSERFAALPIDPSGGGTWLAATDAGLAFALLNVNSPSARYTGPTSRGLLIPALLGCENLEDATSRALKLDQKRFSPCRLVVADAQGCAVVHWDGLRRELELRPLATPMLFTSSGLGDAVILRPRLELFKQMLAPCGTVTAQDAFHRHRWPDRPQLSVDMARADARTVSYSVIEVGPQRIQLAYQDGAPGDAGACTVLELCPQSRVAA
jgi:hypothetical protein